MIDDSYSRGKKQRIRKKIQALKNPQEPGSEPKQEAPVQKEVPAKQRVQDLLNKREEKMQRKERAKLS